MLLITFYILYLYLKEYFNKLPTVGSKEMGRYRQINCRGPGRPPPPGLAFAKKPSVGRVNILACKFMAASMRHYLSTTMSRTWWCHLIYTSVCVSCQTYTQSCILFLNLCSHSQAYLSPRWWLRNTFPYTLEFNKPCLIRTSTFCDNWLIM